jgi:hypothetical protein
LPQPRTVVLNYDPTATPVQFGPDPRQIPVKPEDTIHFRIGPGTRASHPGCKLRITLHNSEHFSKGMLQHAPGQDGTEDLVLRALPDLPAPLPGVTNQVITGYKCELLHANGQPILGLVSDGSTGGDIVPDRAGL